MWSLIASAVLPAVIDFVKSSGPAISRKVFGESVDEQIKLDTAAVQKLEVLAKLDNPYGSPSQWVVDLRASFRYLAALFLIVGGAGLAYFGATTSNPELTAIGLETAGQPFAFIFGERLYFGLKVGRK